MALLFAIPTLGSRHSHKLVAIGADSTAIMDATGISVITSEEYIFGMVLQLSVQIQAYGCRCNRCRDMDNRSLRRLLSCSIKPSLLRVSYATLVMFSLCQVNLVLYMVLMIVIIFRLDGTSPYSYSGIPPAALETYYAPSPPVLETYYVRPSPHPPQQLVLKQQIEYYFRYSHNSIDASLSRSGI